MKLNKKMLWTGVSALTLVGLVTATGASAASLSAEKNSMATFGRMGGHGLHLGIGDPDRFLERLTSEASMLGISVDEMKSYWSQGKGVKEIATEKGITEEQLKTKMQAAAETKIKAELKTLVDKGIITQAQADARLATMKAMKEKMGEQMKNRMQNKVQNKLHKRAAPVQNGTNSQS